MSADRPLQTVRVIDFSRLLPGGFATRILAELGAEVIKIEAPPGGDPSRAIPPFQQGVSHHHLTINAGKKSLAVSLKHKGGVEVVRRLAARADVVLENSRPGVAARLGIDYQSLCAQNPGLIYCSLSGFGQEGPLSDAAGFDLNFLALAGILSLQPRSEAGTPALPGLVIADLAASLWTVIACLAALQARSHTGRGQFIDVAMQDTAISLLTILAGRHFTAPQQPLPGDFTGESAAWNVYATQDGRHITLTAYDPQFWQRFCAAVGRPDLAPYGFHNPERRPWVLAEVRALFQSRTLADWQALLSEHDVSHAPVLNLAEVFAHPHTTARNLVHRIDHPLAGAVRQLAHPVRYAGEQPPALAGAPELGADTRSLLLELGYDDAAVADLLSGGAVSAPDSAPKP